MEKENEASQLCCEGIELQEVGKVDDAAKKYCSAITNPAEAPIAKSTAFNNLGVILLAKGFAEKAAGCFWYSIQIKDDIAAVHNNWANCRMMVGDLKTANEHFNRAIKLDPACADAHQNAAFVKLLTGDLAEGFKAYEWRWKCEAFPTKPYPTSKPRWQGYGPRGSIVLLTHEQGFGDSIQFIRYAKMVKERGHIVHFIGPPELECVISRVDGVDKYLTVDTHEDFDFHCPLMSLPHVFKTRLGTIPAEIPYISAPTGLLGLPDTNNPRVGIVWAGRPEHGKDKWRSVTAGHFRDLLAVPGVDFFSFQMGPKEIQAEEFPQITRLAPKLKSFTETASGLADMDLLITVDTSVAHLAGAIGRPVWMLTPYNPDWRWLLETTKSPWYPTMRLFRQPELDDWGSVFAAVKPELERLAECHSTQMNCEMT